MSFIQIEHLSKTYKGQDDSVHALNDINLNIEKGEIYGIIGLSGAGKSTLVRCINLLERPCEGKILIDGKNMPELSEKELREERRKIAMIFQQFNLLMQRNVLDNVCFPLEIAGVKLKVARLKSREFLKTV